MRMRLGRSTVRFSGFYVVVDNTPIHLVVWAESVDNPWGGFTTRWSDAGLRSVGTGIERVLGSDKIESPFGESDVKGLGRRLLVRQCTEICRHQGAERGDEFAYGLWFSGRPVHSVTAIVMMQLVRRYVGYESCEVVDACDGLSGTAAVDEGSEGCGDPSESFGERVGVRAVSESRSDDEGFSSTTHS